MAAHNWSFDQPTGVYKNHAISNELLFAAAGRTKLLAFTQVPGQAFGKHMGETINLIRVNRLPIPANNGVLDESIRIPIDKLTLGQRSITVTEHGRGVEYTNLNEQLSVFDPSNYLQKELMRQMEYSVDAAIGSAFQSTEAQVVFIPTSATGGTFDTDGTPSSLASAEFTFAHTGVISDYMAGDIHVPPWTAEHFVGATTRRTLRGLKNDNLLQSVHLYLREGDFFFRGEVGMTENIRWVQVDVETTLSNTAGSSTTIGEGMVFGDEAVARVEVEAPHLRADPNYQNDFGRSRAVAWYGIYAFAPFYDVATDGFARIVRIGSS
jgi:N4-gp56 family major capsid protein